VAEGWSLLRTLVRDAVLRRAVLALAFFELAEYGPWIAMLVFAYDHGGATTAGLVALAQLVPSAFFAPLAGLIADRYGASRVLLGGYVAQGVAMAATAASMLVGAPPVLVYALGAVTATAITVTHPSHAVVSPGIAHTPEALIALNAVSGWVWSLALIVAPAATGLLLAVSSPGGVFAAGTACLAFSAVLVFPLRDVVPPLPRGDEPAVASSAEKLLEGIRALGGGSATGDVMIVLASTYLMVGAFDVLAVVLAVDVHDMGGSGAGYLNALHGGGALIGAVVSLVVLARGRVMPVLIAAALAGAVAFVVLGTYASLAVAFLAVALAGASRSLLDVSARTLLQRVTPTALLARVFALTEGLAMAALAVGSIAVPGLIWLGGVRLALVGTGLVVPVVVLVRFRHLVRVDSAAAVPVVEIALLRSMRIFRALPIPALEGIARNVVTSRVDAGTAIVEQGEGGDRYYAIVDGIVDVDDGRHHLATLGRGEGFGEIALLRNTSRSATVTARTDTRLLEIEQDAFLVALTGHPKSAAVAEAIVSERG
jgi:MFS family permease